MRLAPALVAVAALEAARSPAADAAANIVPTQAPPPGEALSYYCSWYAQNYALCDTGHTGGDVYVFGPHHRSQLQAEAGAAPGPPPGIKNVFLNTSLIVEACETTAPGSAEPVGRQKWVANADGSLTNALLGGYATVYKCEWQPPRVPPPGHGRPMYVSKDADDTCGGLNQRFSINSNGTITSMLDSNWGPAAP